MTVGDKRQPVPHPFLVYLTVHDLISAPGRGSMVRPPA